MVEPPHALVVGAVVPEADVGAALEVSALFRLEVLLEPVAQRERPFAWPVLLDHGEAGAPQIVDGCALTLVEPDLRPLAAGLDVVPQVLAENGFRRLEVRNDSAG